MGTSMNSSGLRLEDHNNLKYSIGLTRVGQEVFLRVFRWGFKGKISDIKSALLALPGYNNTRFRKDFNTSQRDKLEKGDPLSMDITLIYKLVQMLCGLSDPSDSVWITEESESLEYYLYAIKMKRNEIAHDGLMLTSVQLKAMIEDLRSMFLKIISKASTAFRIDIEEKDRMMQLINTRLDAIRDSPVPLPTIVEHEKEVFTNRKTCIIEDGRRETVRLREVVCQTSVVPCLTQQTTNVNNIYTEPKLKRDETQITQRQLSEEESYINVNGLLEAKECDGCLPSIILISALNGMGRSTMLKYLLERGLSNSIRGIENLDLLLCLECRKTSFSTVDELVSLLLPRTSATFQSEQFTQCFLSVDFLVMFDDIDELDEKSLTVFEKFIQVISPTSRVVLTVSKEKAKDVQRKISALHKRAMLLELEGINENHTLKHLHKILQSLPSKSHDHQEKELYELIKAKYPYLQDHLRSPEILGLIAFGWFYAPDRVNETTTVTEIFLLVEDLLIHKIHLSLLSSSIPSMLDQGTIHSNLYKFLLTLSSVAFDTLKVGRSNIESTNLDKIFCMCKDLDLPKNIISLFLSYVDEQNPAPILALRKVSFPRCSTLQYYAAWFITQEIKEAESSATIKQLMGVTNFSEESFPNYQAMFKYLVGMIATLIPHQLKSRAKEIVGLLKEVRVSKTSQWLQYIEEAKTEPKITQEIMKEMGDIWETEDYSISTTLRNILEKKRPSSLTMTVCRKPLDIPHLQRVLEVCRDYQEMNVSLHLYQHFWSEKIDFSDQYLRTLLGTNSLCQLEHFAGRLSGGAISLLPKTLKRLALHITPDMIKTLNEHLARLSALQMLYINFDISESVDPVAVMPLSIPSSVVLSVDLWRIGESTIDWACDVAETLSKSYTRLVLRHSSLNVSGCLKWLKGLYEREIKVSWIVVGSIHDATQEDEDQLCQYAINVGCGKFAWLKI